MSKQITGELDRSVAQWFEQALRKVRECDSTPGPLDNESKVHRGALRQREDSDELRRFDAKLARASEMIDEWIENEVDDAAPPNQADNEDRVRKLYEELQEWVQAQPTPCAANDPHLDQLSAQKQARRRAEQQANEALMADIESMLSTTRPDPPG